MRCDDVYTTILDFNKHIPIRNIHMVVYHRIKIIGPKTPSR